MIFSGFDSRTQAGQLLARKVAAFNFDQPVVLALPRGGVPVAVEIARALKAPLDLLFVRKIGVPGQPELAAAAIVDGEQPDLVYNEDVMSITGLSKTEIKRAAAKELTEIDRRRKLYLKGRQPVLVEGHTAIIVDDGIATGTTVKAALQALRRRKPKKLVLAVAVAPPDTIAELRGYVDEIICLQQPEPFFAIGNFYRDFHQVSDEEVIEMMRATTDLDKSNN
jgi:putative phosphoribosyl transferase